MAPLASHSKWCIPCDRSSLQEVNGFALLFATTTIEIHDLDGKTVVDVKDYEALQSATWVFGHNRRVLVLALGPESKEAVEGVVEALCEEQST